MQKNLEYDYVPTDQMGLVPKVSLVNAKALYQPVGSTSGGSKYFVVGVFSSGLNVAARYLGGKLSIRIEGDISGSAGILKELGITGGGGLSGNYVSLHLNPHTDMDASKALGAVLCSLAMKTMMLTPMPNIFEIKGKGS